MYGHTDRGFFVVGMAAVEFFKHLLGDQHGRSGDDVILDVIRKCVSDEDNNMLYEMVMKEEVKSVLFHLHPDKVLGPDGFTARFFQNCWSFICDDLWMLVDFCRTKRFVKYLNNLVIALVIKNLNAIPLVTTDPFLYAIQYTR